jgi:chemotaxis protein MotB
LSRKQVTEETAQTPLWIITFSDMTTNLLTFFVLLVSMGTMRDDTLADQGKALTFLGEVKLGFGFNEQIAFGHMGIKYNIPEPDETFDVRTIDAKEENLRRTFEELKKSALIINSEASSERAAFSVINVHFPPGQAALDSQNTKILTEFCRDLQQSTNNEPGILFVLGLAADVATDRQRLLLSAKRAEAVAQFLRTNLVLNINRQELSDLIPSEDSSAWSVYSWGAGEGGDWAGPNGAMSGQSQILIAILRPNGS